jgi:hypothetical protein
MGTLRTRRQTTRQNSGAWTIRCLAGAMTLALILSSSPAQGSVPREPTACSLLTASQASAELGGPVVPDPGNTSTFCSFTRPGTVAKQTLVSLVLVPQTSKGNLARAEALLKASSNLRIDGARAVWHVIPKHLAGGDKAGSLTSIKNGLLLLVSVRGVVNPKTTAVQAMSHVLRRM